ncbi:MAG: bifunctional precorrin-2 dehydrogenase/sirohydrochlorin ferrochelatase [Magnetococcales bacterium]|nr:bifunctional precorrin-2 dehydrogenase/sirohydrochlorin ferrochelatase [Magnetococcales bacterium]
MPHYMAELVLTDQPVLMVGGGRVARRKLAGLQAAGARIRVVAPELDPWIAGQVADGVLDHVPEAFVEAHLEARPRPVLVFAATATATLNRTIAAACRQRGLLCNSADDPEASGFLVPAVVRRGTVTVAVATQGRSPALSRLLKERIEAWLEPGWGPLAGLFGAMRQRVRERLPEGEQRQRFWRATALAAAAEQRFRQEDNHAWFQDRLDRAAHAPLPPGESVLPGSPEALQDGPMPAEFRIPTGHGLPEGR